MQQESSLRPDQVTQVRGFADQRLRNLKDPLDPANRRVSIIVQYISGNADEEEPVGADTKTSDEKPPAGAKAESETTGKKVEK